MLGCSFVVNWGSGMLIIVHLCTEFCSVLSKGLYNNSVPEKWVSVKFLKRSGDKISKYTQDGCMRMQFMLK